MAEANQSTWDLATKAMTEHRFAEAGRLFGQLHVLHPDDESIAMEVDRVKSFTPDFVAGLRAKDGEKLRKRIYIMGCGRSGTTLLLSMMRCFADTFVLIDPKRGGEDVVARFGMLDAPEPIHVIKRDSIAYRFAGLIPDCIEILYVIRHPLDILASDLKLNQLWERYIKPDRWRPEMSALRELIERRPILVVRYEDLVADPDRVQSVIGSRFGLRASVPFSRFHEAFDPGEIISQTMNGIRAPSMASIGRWSKTPESIAYFRSLWPGVKADVKWVCERFGYDFNAISALLD